MDDEQQECGALVGCRCVGDGGCGCVGGGWRDDGEEECAGDFHAVAVFSWGRFFYEISRVAKARSRRRSERRWISGADGFGGTRMRAEIQALGC